MRADGGIGRHAALRWLWAQARGGSTPLSPTNDNYSNRFNYAYIIMTFTDIFKPEYLFDPTPPQQSKLYLSLLIIFSVLVVLAVLSKFAGKEIKKITNRFFYTFLIGGVLGLIYLFSRYEGLPWLGSRFFLMLIVTMIVIWLAVDLITILIYLKVHSSEEENEKKYRQYLPKPKRIKVGKRQTR